MKLKYVHILNFKSIQDIKIEFEPACKFLVGINESGKSNILRALSLLDVNLKTNKDEIREPGIDEPEIYESNVDFVFDFDENEISEVCKVVEAEFLSKDKNAAIIMNGEKALSLADFCKLRCQGIYWVNLIEGTKTFANWSLNKSFVLKSNWKTHVEYKKGPLPKIKSLKNCQFVNTEDYKEIPIENFVELKINEIDNLITTEVKRITKEKLPKTVLWEFSSSNLMPSSVVIEAFKSNPTSCLPLKNMFNLCGIQDINKAITEAMAGSSNKFSNLLDRVARKTTEHIQDVWKDYKNIEFSLSPNGPNIEIHIKEKNRFLFNHRSDGFKRFVTFILMISTTVRNNTFNNTLLLVDEPEIGLHPSGVKDLRNELIKISRTNNYVIGSTHSIFMIDPDNIGRHYIVNKHDEITSISVADEGNLAEEEVIYKGFKFSLYEILSKKNVIFEGWRDKELFRIAMKELPHGYKTLKDKFKDIGICHADGVKMIKNITPLLELGNRECLILSDEDEPAKQHQKEYNKIKHHGVWRTYSEVDSSLNVYTGEDFIKDEIVIKSIATVKKQYPAIATKPNPTLSHAKGKITAIREWLNSCGMTKVDADKVINEIKACIFRDLKTSEIELKYYIYLKGVASLLG